MNHIEQKQYKEALSIWSEARAKMEEPDFRIAQKFIRIVTKRNIGSYYREASNIYYWGLSGQISKKEQRYLLRELSLMKPLLDYKKFKKLKNKVEDRNETVLSDIKNFWKNIDITPFNNYNERLLEHWKRVAHTREKYALTIKDELDDRSYTYIKYGEPYYTRNGRLTYKSSLVHRLLLEGIKTPSFASVKEIDIATAQRYNLETRVRQLHNYPKYEVWIYKNLTDNNQNTIFIFGNQGNASTMEKIQTVSDFIPSNAYRNKGQHNYSGIPKNTKKTSNTEVEVEVGKLSRNVTKRVNITPALILQLMYYDQLAALDKYFGNSYNEMMNRYMDLANTPASNMKGLARQFSSIYGSKLLHIQLSAPSEKSQAIRNLFNLPVETYTYRFLNSNNEPYFKLYSLLEIEDAYLYDQLKKSNTITNNIGDYTLLSGYIIRDNKQNKIGQYSRNYNITSPDSTQIALNIPHKSLNQSVTISHELHNKREMSKGEISGNSLYPESLKGLANKKLTLPKPLDNNSLTLSDIILGYSTESNYQQNPKDSLNFNIAHKKVIPESSDLNLYYELYNLKSNMENKQKTTNFTFHYTIQKKAARNGIFGLGIFKKNTDAISITLNNTTTKNHYKGELVIETSNRKPGKYVLDIQIEQSKTGTSIKRSIPFSIK